ALDLANKVFRVRPADPTAVVRVASIEMLIADTADNLAQSDTAIAVDVAARALLVEHAARHPGSELVREYLAWAEFMLAEHHLEPGELGPAVAAFRRALATRLELLDADRQDERRWVRVGAARLWLAMALVERGEDSAGAVEYEESLGIFRRL